MIFRERQIERILKRFGEGTTKTRKENENENLNVDCKELVAMLVAAGITFVPAFIMIVIVISFAMLLFVS